MLKKRIHELRGPEYYAVQAVQYEESHHAAEAKREEDLLYFYAN